MPSSISTVRFEGVPSSSTVSEPRRPGIVPSSTTVTPSAARRRQRALVAVDSTVGPGRRLREAAAIAAPHGRDRVRGALERRLAHLRGMRVADRLVRDGPEAEALRRVEARLLEAAVVEQQHLGFAALQIELP